MKTSSNLTHLAVALLLTFTAACKPSHKSTETVPEAVADPTPTPVETAPAVTASAAPTAKVTHAAPAVHPKVAAGGGAAAADAPCPGPGITRRCGGRCVSLQTDDSNCGSCGTVCSGGKHYDGHLFCRDSAGNL
ncbi:MAG: hypothetical protein ABIP89_12885 [Polyangiaceae bacterium]